MATNKRKNLNTIPSNPEVRRSGRSSKGQGGIIEQLNTVGKQVSHKPHARKKHFQMDDDSAAGEGSSGALPTNPMAPSVIKPVCRRNQVCSIAYFLASILLTE